MLIIDRHQQILEILKRERSASVTRLARELFASESIVVPKKGKNGTVDQDIVPLIRKLDVAGEGNVVILNAMICCQNPTLNPAQIAAAIEMHLPELRPDVCTCQRIEVYDMKEEIFR